MIAELRAIAQQWTPGAVILRIAAMALLWLILAEGEFHYWALTLLAILGGAFASLVLIPATGLRMSLTGWARFIPFFLWQSVLGGTDVALRAITPTPRLNPGYVEFRFRIEEEPARVFVVNAMSLMPGALCVSLDGDRLRIHVLDRAMPAVEQARAVETHAARMFGLKLSD